jgi:hypothetical protein
VQAWLNTGVPPVHPAGELEATVLVWVPLDWQAPHAEYVKDEHVAGGGGAAGLLLASPGFVPALISVMLVAPSPSESKDAIELKL